MRAAACLNAHDALCRERLRAGQDELVFLGVNVVGYHIDVVEIPEMLAKRLYKRRLARADRAPDPDAERPVMCGSGPVGEKGLFAFNRLHDRNSLVYWVPCAMEAS